MNKKLSNSPPLNSVVEGVRLYVYLYLDAKNIQEEIKLVRHMFASENDT